MLFDVLLPIIVLLKCFENILLNLIIETSSDVLYFNGSLWNENEKNVV